MRLNSVLLQGGLRREQDVIAYEHTGDTSGAFNTTVLPAASGYVIDRTRIYGAFHGAAASITPYSSLNTRAFTFFGDMDGGTSAIIIRGLD